MRNQFYTHARIYVVKLLKFDSHVDKTDLRQFTDNFEFHNGQWIYCAWPYSNILLMILLTYLIVSNFKCIETR